MNDERERTVADAAEALGVSEQTVRNWDQNGCPFDPNYPGRFNAIIFYQWAQTFRSLQNFRREAKKRARSRSNTGDTSNCSTSATRRTHKLG